MGSRTTLICTNCHERRFPQSFPVNSSGQRPPRWAVCFPCREGIRDQLLWLRKHMRTWSEVGRFVGIYDAHRLRYVAMLQWPRLDIREAITGAVDRVKGRIAEAKGNHAPRRSCVPDASRRSGETPAQKPDMWGCDERISPNNQRRVGRPRRHLG